MDACCSLRSVDIHRSSASGMLYSAGKPVFHFCTITFTHKKSPSFYKIGLKPVSCISQFARRSESELAFGHATNKYVFKTRNVPMLDFPNQYNTWLPE
jgi:hypothetical protein